MKYIATAAVSLALFGTTMNTHLANITKVHSMPHKPKATVAAVQKPAETKPAPVMVAVQSGDTLTSIATANDTTYDRLFDANDTLTDPNVINPGQQLRVPAASEQLPDRMPAAVLVTAAASSSTSPRRMATAVAYPAVTGNDAKAFIYSHESGNNPNSTSPRGCYGLGQDCNGVVRAQCGADYACQDAYFTGYMTRRYGSWDAAAAFWQANGWW